MKTVTNYKNYTIETINGSSYIRLEGEFVGCTHSDLKLNNSEDKAKIRIDNNKVNLLTEILDNN